MQSAELPNAVEAVAAVGIDAIGRQQTELVVMAQHARGDLAKPSELSDVQHDQAIDTPSHRVNVKPEAHRRRARLTSREVAAAAQPDP